MLVHHSTMERISYSLKIHLILHLSFLEKIEDDFVRFSSTPLFDISDHEDAEEFIDCSDHGGRDPFSSIFYGDHESIAVDLSKPPV